MLGDMFTQAAAPDACLYFPMGHGAQVPSSAVDPASPLTADALLNSEPAAHVALVMAWHAESSDTDLNWPTGHKVQAPSSAVDPVSPLVAESLLNPKPAAIRVSERKVRKRLD